jgi:hypothetical protein
LPARSACWFDNPATLPPGRERLLVLAQWPVSGLWVIGLFVGIELIFYGGAWIALALGLRSLR